MSSHVIKSAENQPTLRLEGDTASPQTLSFAELAALPENCQVRDVSRIDPKRQGDAVTLRALFELARPAAAVNWLGLHASADDFHASIPLGPVLEKAILIYSLHNQPLPVQSGGPFRFYIPDHHACKTHEIDECANVKFVDRIEFSIEPTRDNRPHDAAEHADLHARAEVEK